MRARIEHAVHRVRERHVPAVFGRGAGDRRIELRQLVHQFIGALDHRFLTQPIGLPFLIAAGKQRRGDPR